jgi:hypothetical protein
MGMKPHKHAELIKAWADGAKIQEFHDVINEWLLISHPRWNEHKEYRIQPEPKPDFETYLCKINHQWHEFNIEPRHKGWASIKLIWDGETKELKNSKVLK